MTIQQIANWLLQAWQSLAGWFSAACSATGTLPPAHFPHFDATLNGKLGTYVEDAFRAVGPPDLPGRTNPAFWHR